MGEALLPEGNRPFIQSSKCKIATIAAILIVIVEIMSVQRWETQRSFRGGEKLMFWEYNKQTATKDNDTTLVEVSLPSTPQSAKLTPTVSASTSAATEQLPPKEGSNYAVRKYIALRDELEEKLLAATDKKIILIWVPMFGVKTSYSVDSGKCGNCEVTYDRSKINDDATGAVVFHFDAIRPNNMPPNRNPKHLYIFWDLESAATLKVVRGHSLQFEDSTKFNGSMTYRLDSDFYMNYDFADSISRIVESKDITPEKVLSEKTKVAVAVVSNCGYTPGAKTRLRMLKELQSMKFPLDGFGNCFGRKIAGGKHRKSQEFHNEVRKYKFYFSFENSFHCKDYITEKFFNNAIASLAVPVVWGTKKEDYEAVAPPGSFIYADDFSSMKELADYLNYLDKNDSAYLEYLRWITMKPSAMPQYGRAKDFCRICRVLHGINIDDIYSPKFNESSLERPLFTDGVAPRTVNLKETFYSEDYRECFNR